MSNDVLGTKCLIHEKFFVIYFFRGKFAFSRRRHEQAQKKETPSCAEGVSCKLHYRLLSKGNPDIPCISNDLTLPTGIRFWNIDTSGISLNDEHLG